MSSSALLQYTDVPLAKFSGPAEQFYWNLTRPASTVPSSLSGPSTPNPMSASVSWSLSQPDYNRYLDYFSQADGDRDGFVSGPEARIFFKQSQLSSEALREIWILSDIDKDGKLKREEFIIAMHLVMLVRTQKIALPKVVPQELIQSIATFSSSRRGSLSHGDPPDLLRSMSGASIAPYQHAVHTEPSLPSDQMYDGGLTRDITAAKSAIEQHKRDIEETKENVIVSKRKHAELKNQLDLYHTQLDTLKTQCEDYGKMYSEHKAQVDEVQNRINRVKEELETLRRSMNERSVEVSHGQETIYELEKEERDYQLQYSHIAKQLEAENQAIASSKKHQESLRDQIRQFQDLIKNQKTILDSRRTHKRSIDIENASLEEELRQTKDQLEKMKSETDLISKSHSRNSSSHGVRDPIANAFPANSGNRPKEASSREYNGKSVANTTIVKNAEARPFENGFDEEFPEFEDNFDPELDIGFDPPSDFKTGSGIQMPAQPVIQESSSSLGHLNAQDLAENPFAVDDDWPEADLGDLDAQFPDFETNFDAEEQKPNPLLTETKHTVKDSTTEKETREKPSHQRKSTMDKFDFGGEADFGGFNDEFNDPSWEM